MPFKIIKSSSAFHKTIRSAGKPMPQLLVRFTSTDYQRTRDGSRVKIDEVYVEKNRTKANQWASKYNKPNPFKAASRSSLNRNQPAAICMPPQRPDAATKLLQEKQLSALLSLISSSKGNDLKVDGVFGNKTISKFQNWVNHVQPDECDPIRRDGVLGQKTVRALQLSLSKFGYEVKVDGSFGPKTVSKLQELTNKENEREIKVDGVLGNKTARALQHMILHNASCGPSQQMSA